MKLRLEFFSNKVVQSLWARFIVIERSFIKDYLNELSSFDHRELLLADISDLSRLAKY